MDRRKGKNEDREKCKEKQNLKDRNASKTGEGVKYVLDGVHITFKSCTYARRCYL